MLAIAVPILLLVLVMLSAAVCEMQGSKEVFINTMRIIILYFIRFAIPRQPIRGKLPV